MWVLDKVRRLIDIETSENYGLFVILSGQSALDELLNEQDFESMCDRSGPRIVLAAFTLPESREYIRQLVESAGKIKINEVFEFQLITLIHELCSGVPEEINRLCRRCLELKDEENSCSVTSEIVTRAGEQLQLLSTAQKPLTALGSAATRGDRFPKGRLIVRVNSVVIAEQALRTGGILIGRDRQCEVSVASPVVSRHHALIITLSKGVKLVDLRSTNGTKVSGRKVEQCMLEDNDTIAIGDYRIEYISGTDHQASSSNSERTDEFEAHIAELSPPIEYMAKDIQELTAGISARLSDLKGTKE